MSENLLTKPNIVGAVLMSRSGELSHYCLKNLLKYCKKVVVLLDNPDDLTRRIVEHYKNNYREVVVFESTLAGTTQAEEEKNPLLVKIRFRENQGPIRQQMFDNLKKLTAEGLKIDILVWPDSDEVFSDNFPVLIEQFWPSKFKAITMKAADVFGDFETIMDGMTGHTRIFKYTPELTAMPYRWATNYLPIRRAERMGCRFTLIHLSLLTKESIEWKLKYWSHGELDKDKKLWKTGKDVRTMTPVEIAAAYARPPDLTIGEYLRGGAKRMPVGINNARKALREATDILDQMKIRYYLAFGTCLGIVRDKAIIPWDWDIDLIMLGEDIKKFDHRVFAANGFHDFKIKQDIPKWIKGEEKSEENYLRTISFKKHGVRVDIDPAHRSADGGGLIILKGRKREQFCAWHPNEWFDNPATVSFDGKDYLVPSPVEDYLISNYGENWRHPQYGPMDWHERPCMRREYECM